MSQAGKELVALEDQVNWHWRNSMKPVRFFAFDARAALPLPILIVYFRLSTFLIAIGFLLFFRYLEQKGLTFPAALRALRSWLVGKTRPGWVGALKNKFVDYL
ncbi:IcmT/TraK family protein [Alphaproteobacteria bacterium]|nr:IcmT/TraK family protein [Alphaproteobacteria bacterium]